MITQQCFTFRVRKSAKGKRPRKKRDWIQDCNVTEGGRFGPHPVPPGLKQRNNGTRTQMCPLILSTLIKDAFFSGRWPITKERYKKGGRGGGV